MRLALAVVASVALLLSGCGEDAPREQATSLPAGDVALVEWHRAQPERPCESRRAASRRDGRRVVLAANHGAPEDCWLAVDATRPLARRTDVADVTRLGDGKLRVRFDPAVRDALVALGPASHVGLIVGGRLLAVGHPAGGELRF